MIVLLKCSTYVPNIASGFKVVLEEMMCSVLSLVIWKQFLNQACKWLNHLFLFNFMVIY